MRSVERCDQVLRMIDEVLGEQRRARDEWRRRALAPRPAPVPTPQASAPAMTASRAAGA